MRNLRLVIQFMASWKAIAAAGDWMSTSAGAEPGRKDFAVRATPLDGLFVVEREGNSVRRIETRRNAP